MNDDPPPAPIQVCTCLAQASLTTPGVCNYVYFQPFIRTCIRGILAKCTYLHNSFLQISNALKRKATSTAATDFGLPEALEPLSVGGDVTPAVPQQKRSKADLESAKVLPFSKITIL